MFPLTFPLQCYIYPDPSKQRIRMITVGETVHILHTQESQDVGKSYGSFHIGCRSVLVGSCGEIVKVSRQSGIVLLTQPAIRCPQGMSSLLQSVE